MNNKISDFTVVFIYPDTAECCVDHVTGEDWKKALSRFFHEPECSESRQGFARVVAVFPGALVDLMEGPFEDGLVSYDAALFPKPASE